MTRILRDIPEGHRKTELNRRLPGRSGRNADLETTQQTATGNQLTA